MQAPSNVYNDLLTALGAGSRVAPSRQMCVIELTGGLLAFPYIFRVGDYMP